MGGADEIAARAGFDASIKFSSRASREVDAYSFERISSMGANAAPGAAKEVAVSKA